MEAELTPLLRDALDELRELLDVEDWTTTQIAPPFQVAACVLCAAKLVRSGLAPTKALDTAAAHLELEVEAVRSRATRWSKASRRHVHNARGARRTGVYSLIEDASEHAPEVAA